MRICFVDTLGLPYTGDTIKRTGLGGSESAVIYLSKELVKLGFNVTVFNDCESNGHTPGIYDGVVYLPLKTVETVQEYFDVMIASRTVAPFFEKPNEIFKHYKTLPSFRNIINRSAHKVLWMHDTFCDGDNLIEDLIKDKRLDEIFTLTDWHTSYVTTCNHGRYRNFDLLKKHIFMTRNGIGARPEKWVDIKQKDPNLFVFNASVTKGMFPLVTKIWPKIKEKRPDAKLTVIGGYYRFKDNNPDQQELDWRNLVEKYGNDIEFTGVISQPQISDILTKASYMIYPAAFPETFGISTLEALAHNVPLITCNFGALEETAISAACYKIEHPVEKNFSCEWLDEEKQCNDFVDLAIEAYDNTYLHQQKMYMCNQVKDICNWDSIALQWKQHFYKKLNRYLDINEYRAVQNINHRVHEVFGRRFYNYEEAQYAKQTTQKKIVIATPVYNSEAYIANCILSVASQDYDNYEMIIVDDLSIDNTVDQAQKAIDSLPENIKSKFSIMVRSEHTGSAVNNQAYICDSLETRDAIIMLLDGDDTLINNPNIFHMYNNLYTQDQCEFTYGSCWSLADNIPLIAQEYPPHIKESRAYRDYKFNWNMPYTHLRTFSLDVFNRIDRQLLIDQNTGKYYGPGGDGALFYSLIEACDPDKVVCVSDVVYAYNDLNPINDYKVNSEEQTKTANDILMQQRANLRSAVLARRGVTTDVLIPREDTNTTEHEFTSAPAEVKTKNILIAIPCKNDIEADTFKSIYDQIVPAGYNTEFQYSYGYAVDQVRNLIGDWVRTRDYDYLFSVDHDMTFPPDTLARLLAHDKDVVGALYRQRVPEVVVEAYDTNYNRIPVDVFNRENGLIEVGAVGFGCTLVKKQVFTEIPYPNFVYTQGLTMDQTFSEDVDFCKRARDNNFTVWLDAGIRCGHIGQHVYTV